MGSIRVGFFEDFKGADTVLIDVDGEGLRGLVAWLRDVMSSDRKAVLSACPGVTLKSTLRVDVFKSPEDIGLVRAAERVFVWQRSEDGWTDVVEKLAAMETGAGHQIFTSSNQLISWMQLVEHLRLAASFESQVHSESACIANSRTREGGLPTTIARVRQARNHSIQAVTSIVPRWVCSRMR